MKMKTLDTNHSEREHEALWDNFESDLAEYAVRNNLPDDWQRDVFDEAAPELTSDGSNDYGTDLRAELVALGYLAISELEPVTYYDLGDSAFYRYVVEFEDGTCVWLTADCLPGSGFVKSSETDEDVPTSAVEITDDDLPVNVAESLDSWIGA